MSKPNKRKLLIILTIVFVDLLGFGMIIPLLALYAKHYGANTLELAIFGCIYSFMQFIFSPFWGSLSDRYGRRPILLISLAGSSISYLIFAMANTYSVLLASRAFAGIFTANISTAHAYVTDSTEAKDRIKYMGLIGAAIGLGFTIGPAFGGFSAKFLGFRSPGIIASAICFINFIIAFKYLEESLNKENQEPIKNKLNFINFNLSTLKKTFSNKTLAVFLIAGFLATLAFSHLEQCFSLLLQSSLNYTTIEAAYKSGMMLLVMGVVGVIIQGFLITKITTKLGEVNTLLTGALLNSVALPFFSVSNSYLVFLLAAIPISIGTSLINPCISSLVSKHANVSNRGEVFGVSQSLSSLARVIGPFAGLSAFGIFPVLPFFVASGIYLILYFSIRMKISKKESKTKLHD